MGRTEQDRLMCPVQDVHVGQDFIVDRGRGIATSPETTPIVINNFNRLEYLRRLLAALGSRGYENVYVIDNHSTYEPLLRYYEGSGLRVFRLDANVGYLALWTTPIGEQFADDYYIYTDPDIEPVPECPDDFVAHFRDVLRRHPDIDKVGFGLKTDDLPVTYGMRAEVIEHERGITKGRDSTPLYRAPIDTTLALYRPHAAGGFWLPAMRTGSPYLARHLPWYVDSSEPDEEETYYRRTVRASTHWTLLEQGETPGVMTVMLWGEPVRVVADQRAAALNIAWRPEWQPETYDALDRFLDDGRPYLELGSGIGQTALYGARRASVVYAVECDVATYAILTRNVALNAGTTGNVEALNVCVASRPVAGRSVAFADLEAMRPLEECALVKMDVGGAEYRILPTMVPYLKRVRPSLHVIMHPRRHFWIEGSSMLERVALGLAGIASTASVMWRLRFYRHVYSASGESVRLRDLPKVCRSTFGLTFTDRVPGDPDGDQPENRPVTPRL